MTEEAGAADPAGGERGLVRDSKFLSSVLRHNPGKIGVELGSGGLGRGTEVLLAAARRAGRRIGRERLDRVVEHNNKKRFEYDASGTRIRASQGHSVPVDLGYEPLVPPETLFHGTGDELAGLRSSARASSRADGITCTFPRTSRRRRRSVARHGKPAVLLVAAGRMHGDGREFLRSTNGVWLTEHVAPAYLSFDSSGR